MKCRYVRALGTVSVNSLIWDGGSIHDGFVAQISIIWDSRYESSVIAGVYGQLDTYDVQDPELGRV